MNRIFTTDKHSDVGEPKPMLYLSFKRKFDGRYDYCLREQSAGIKRRFSQKSQGLSILLNGRKKAEQTFVPSQELTDKCMFVNILVIAIVSLPDM